MTHLPNFDEVKTISDIFLYEKHNNTKVVNIPTFKNLKSAKDIIIDGLSKAKYLYGFDSLETAGKIRLQTLLGLQNITGFSRVKKVSSVVISTNGKLETIIGFENLEETNVGGIGIYSNGVLKEIKGFGKVKKVNSLTFSFNHINFEKLDCFTALEEVVLDISMQNNQKMHSVYFPKLKKIGGKLHLQNNRRLESIEGFASLEELGIIALSHNDVLSSIKPLENINSDLLQYVFFMYNDSCNICSVKPICEYLDGRTQWHFNDKIEGNAIGCRSVEEILANCETSSTEQNAVYNIKIKQPVMDVLEIQDEAGMIKSNKIFTILGEEIKAEENPGYNLWEYNVSHLRQGIYILRYETRDHKTGTVKWIKM